MLLWPAADRHTVSFRFGLLFAGILLLSGCAQQLFYQPDRVLYDTPQRVGLNFEEVNFKSKDGTRLTGWFIPARGYANPLKAKGTVIHFHGNAQNLSAHWRFVEWMPERGYNLFAFDYRGYGRSAGQPDPQGVFDDANSALDYIRSRPDVDPQKLVVIGQSLGGANAIAVVGAGNRKGIRAVIIESSFYSYSSIANDKLWGAGALMSNTYSSDRYIANISPIPLLLLHGTADPVVAPSHSEKLYAKAREPKRLLLIEGGGHAQAFTPRFGTTYIDIAQRFIDDALAAQDLPVTGERH